MLDKLKKMQMAALIALIFTVFACIYFTLISFVPAGPNTELIKEVLHIVGSTLSFIAGWAFTRSPDEASKNKKSTEEDV